MWSTDVRVQTAFVDVQRPFLGVWDYYSQLVLSHRPDVFLKCVASTAKNRLFQGVKTGD